MVARFSYSECDYCLVSFPVYAMCMFMQAIGTHSCCQYVPSEGVILQGTGYLHKCCLKCCTQTSLMAKPLTSVRPVGLGFGILGFAKHVFSQNSSQQRCYTYGKRRDECYVGNSMTMQPIQFLEYVYYVKYKKFVYAWNTWMTCYICVHKLCPKCVPNDAIRGLQRGPQTSRIYVQIYLSHEPAN